MKFLNILKKLSFIFALLLEFGLIASFKVQAADSRLPDFNQVEHAQKVALSMINNSNRKVIQYVLKSSVIPDHSLTQHTESYFYSDNPEELGKIIEDVIRSPDNSIDTVTERNTFKLYKTFSKEEAKKLVGRDFIGHDGRTGIDTNRAVVIIDVGGLQEVGNPKLIQQGIHWMGGNISTSFPEHK